MVIVKIYGEVMQSLGTFFLIKLIMPVSIISNEYYGILLISS